MCIRDSSESFVAELGGSAYTSPYIYAKAGLVYERAGRYNDAVRAYLRSLKLNPKDVRVWVNLGNVYARMGKRRKAEEAYRRALEVDPERPEVYFNLGSLYYAEGRYGKAREALEKARDLMPGSPAVLYYLGLVYERQGDLPQAVRCYRLAFRRAKGPLRKALRRRMDALGGS